MLLSVSFYAKESLLVGIMCVMLYTHISRHKRSLLPYQPIQYLTKKRFSYALLGYKARDIFDTLSLSLNG